MKSNYFVPVHNYCDIWQTLFNMGKWGIFISFGPICILYVAPEKIIGCPMWPDLVVTTAVHWSNVDFIHMITRCDHNVYGANIRHLWDIKFPSFQKCLTKIFAQKLFPSPCCNCLSEPLHSGLCTILTFHPLEPTAAECNYLMQTDILFSSIKKMIDLLPI